MSICLAKASLLANSTTHEVVVTKVSESAGSVRVGGTSTPLTLTAGIPPKVALFPLIQTLIQTQVGVLSSIAVSDADVRIGGGMKSWSGSAAAFVGAVVEAWVETEVATAAAAPAKKARVKKAAPAPKAYANGYIPLVGKWDGVNVSSNVVFLATLVREGHNLLLEGPPGTGKTMLAEAIAEELARPFYALVCTASTPDEAFTGLWSLKAGVWHHNLGPLSEAAGASGNAGLLFVDEGHKRGDLDVLLRAMDGRRQVDTGNPDLGVNGVIKADPEFGVVIAGNPDVRGAFLPEAVRDRCTPFTVLTSYRLMRELGVNPRVVALAERMEAERLDRPSAWAPQTRSLVRFMKNEDARGLDYALSQFLMEPHDLNGREELAEAVLTEFGYAPRPIAFGDPAFEADPE